MYTYTNKTHTGIIYAAFILSGQIQAIVYYNIEITVRVFVDAAAARLCLRYQRPVQQVCRVY